MQSVIIFALLGVAASSYIRFEAVDEFTYDEGWQSWKISHNKRYPDNGEEKVRYTIWRDNFRRIVEYNRNSSNMLLAMNQFGDMTNAEFRAKMNGYRGNMKRNNGSTFLPPSNVMIPKEVDWRKEGYVTPVKNQGQCGSCYAFSTTGSVEGQMFKKTDKLVSLSEQQLVDCSGDYDNHGCKGGLMNDAFQYIKDNGGISTEACYPYAGKKEECSYDKSCKEGEVTGYSMISRGSEPELKHATATQGPISVAIDASKMTFQFYRAGVYNEPDCSSTLLDHAVLVVGYGTEKVGGDYWLVKNSWGTTWGEQGYIKMERNKKNKCGIATMASFPLV